MYRNKDAFDNKIYFNIFSEKKKELETNMQKIENKVKDNNIKNNTRYTQIIKFRICNDILKNESKAINNNLINNAYKPFNTSGIVNDINEYFI